MIELTRDVDLLRAQVERLGAQERTLYQEGAWTPSFGGTTTNGTMTYAEQTGVYCRVGSQVTLWFRLRLSTLTTAPTGTLLVRGCPTTPRTWLSHYAGTIGYLSGWATNPFSILAPSFGPIIEFYNSTGGGMTGTALTATSDVIGSISYLV